jgi:hypothetical protein
MSNAFGVHVFDPEQYLFDEVGSFLFGQTFLFRNEIEQLASSKSGNKICILKHFSFINNLKVACDFFFKRELSCR